ncbi:protein of unknown function [[Clostridium] ultunense Esp]|uniref:Uncharacterized protein n=1 Tax=[Clostridium] ultunense Esp TaxID=1288971 RepID=A0A1M4PQ12_9FIRM|nr:protein of unknown function [[Clostridium] ultunense Esp]
MIKIIKLTCAMMVLKTDYIKTNLNIMQYNIMQMNLYLKKRWI